MVLKTNQLEDILAYIKVVKECSGINIDKVEIEIRNLGNCEGAGLDTYSGENTFVKWIDKNGDKQECNVTATNIKYRKI